MCCVVSSHLHRKEAEIDAQENVSGAMRIVCLWVVAMILTRTNQDTRGAMMRPL